MDYVPLLPRVWPFLRLVASPPFPHFLKGIPLILQQGLAILSESFRNRRFLGTWNRYRNRIVPIPGISIGIGIDPKGFSIVLESNMVLGTIHRQFDLLCMIIM